MKSFALRPTLYFGSDAMDSLRQLEGKRVLVVTDSFLASSGLLERVLRHLNGELVTVFDRVTPDPSLELVAQGVQVLRDCCAQVMIAFGGGSPMDCAKAIRWSAQRDIPLWAVPTTAGTGSEMTSFAVLTDTQRNIKHPLVDDSLLPEVSVLDPSLLEGIPASVTADTGADVLSHALEAYVSPEADPFTDALAEKAFLLAWKNLPGAYRGQGNALEKEAMMYASCLAGMAFNGAGLGVCHSLAHALGGRIHMPHGRLNAILLPRVMMYNAAVDTAAEKYGRLGKLCGLSGSARALAGGVSRMLNGLNLPGRLVVDDPKGVAQAALADRCTKTNPRTPTAAELEKLLMELSR